MTVKQLAAACVVSTLALAFISGAQANTIYGLGNMSCDQALKDIGSAETEHEKFFEAAYYEYVYGFLSGYAAGQSAYSEDWDSAIGLTGHDVISAFIQVYCKEYPLDSVADASAGLVAELKNKQGQR